MVRLETCRKYFQWHRFINIYIPVWLDQKLAYDDYTVITKTYLHSSMVRLETAWWSEFANIIMVFTFQYGQIRNSRSPNSTPEKITAFTFQYGQIRNLIADIVMHVELKIYIPVWLDQKL